MLSLKRTPLVIALACLALAAMAAAAYAPASQPLLFEGPGGRTALTRWTLRGDPSNSGAALGWRRGGFAGRTVSVPNVVNPKHYNGRAGALNYEGSVAWYRTTFNAPRAGTYALSFQSANFQAGVWVDGRALGSHRGSYLPFELRASLAAGTHTVVVRIDWRNPGAQSREGFHRTWFNWGGLNGEVNVRPVGDSELSRPTIQTTLGGATGPSPTGPVAPGAPQTTAASVRVSVRVSDHGPTRTITPEGSLVDGSQRVALAFAPLRLAHGRSATASATALLAQPALWSPASPNLYQLNLSVGGESSYTARVGLRELTWHGGHVYLNGARLKLHGASVQEDARGHGDALTPGDEDAIVSELKAIGANVARAQHPLDPTLLERLDAAGILVWQGIGPVEGAGNWYSSTPRLRAGAEAQARTAAIAAALHPSIFAWNLVNEVASNGHSDAEVKYVRNVSRWLHAHDPGRMVAVDVWGDHPPRRMGALYSGVDAIAETDYSGWYDSPHDTPAQLRAHMRSRLAAMERTFAGKVLVISEFGAESNTLNPAGSAGSYAFQSRLLAAHIAVYAADPKVSAMLVWLLRDYPLTPTFDGGSIHHVLPRVKLIEGLNQKGLFTYDGQAKPAVKTVARLFGSPAMR
ncbi:MAG TPA: glycoside hydrolase family 2 TIM barrel-domain containing protein [Solirubrobacteraceae bacterium]|nr:glycoside hydrolase family 2 TIM barrel-domain containing protein [Solirubrobacteraceae bacterium]